MLFNKTVSIVILLIVGCGRLIADQTESKAVNLAYGKSYVTNSKNTSGWNSGLTDGSWASTKEKCFATNCDNNFPKNVTIDLGKEVELSKVVVGVPKFGSTKTVNIEVSTDGKTFTKVASVLFEQKKADKKDAKFTAVKAKFLRLTFPDYYKKKVVYHPQFIFITEVQAYR